MRAARKRVRERAALRELEFGLTGPHSLREIAEFLGVSNREVGRIERRALEKLADLVDESWSTKA